MTSRDTTSSNWQDALLLPSATLGDAVANLNRTGLQIVLVTDADRRLLGTVTDGDVRRGVLQGCGLDSLITNVANLNPMVVPLRLERREVLDLMRTNRIHQLPVVDPLRRVVGLHLLDDLLAPTERGNLMVVMAGGQGTRLRPFTENCPKPLLPVDGKPLLEHILRRARADGFRRFIFAVNYLGSMIEEHFGDGRNWDVEIIYTHETAPLGTAGALTLLEEPPTQSFIVTNGDVLTDANYGDVLDFHVSNGAEATMAVRPYEWQNPFGVVHTEGLIIRGFEEKPVVRSHVNAGIYALEPRALEMLTPGEPCDMPTLFTRLSGAEERIIVYPIHEAWLDVGRPADYQEVNGRAARVVALPGKAP